MNAHETAKKRAIAEGIVWASGWDGPLFARDNARYAKLKQIATLESAIRSCREELASLFTDDEQMADATARLAECEAELRELKGGA